jgi:polysaccharide deacetylase family protein (PEP-CTERM system associated)
MRPGTRRQATTTESDDSTRPTKPATCVFTFDVEEWFHAGNLAVPRNRWKEFPSRLERPVETILTLLDREKARATFFVLGWVASRSAGIVRRIHAAGHEIASHGYYHQPIAEQNAHSFREDVQRAKESLEDIVGEAVTGYRAPSYSINRDTDWALDVLEELGFSYDSSIYPVRAPHGRYGQANSPLGPYRIRRRLWEFPLPTLKLLGWRVPAATGGYLRLWPYALTQRAIAQNAGRAIPVIVNIHPWELDPQQPRWPAPTWRRALHYGNLRTTSRKLSRLLASYGSTSLRELCAR